MQEHGISRVKQDWATEHFSPSSSELILSVFCAISRIIMDFVIYDKRKKSDTVIIFFTMSGHIWLNYSITYHFNSLKQWDFLSGKMLLSTWLETCLIRMLKSFWKPVPLGFWGGCFVSKALHTCSGFMEPEFINWLLQNSFGAGDYCSKEKDKMTHFRPIELMTDRI